MRYRVFPYKAGSQGAKALAYGLGGLVLKVEGSRFRARQDDVVINWGSSTGPRVGIPHTQIINPPDKVKIASNKLDFFMTMDVKDKEVVPPFWTHTDRSQIPESAYPIVCRTVLDGHSGAGIVIAKSPDELVSAPLYVKYIKKQQEFRVHVGDGEVIAVQRKARRRDVADADVNWEVRSKDNGFVFVRNGFDTPDSVTDVATRAVAAVGLDFGAVDVVFNERESKAYVLEINTAPGIEGTTVEDYVRYFTKGE